MEHVVLKQTISETCTQILGEVLFRNQIDLFGSVRAHRLLPEIINSIFSWGFQDTAFEDINRMALIPTSQDSHFDPSFFLKGETTFLKLRSPKGSTSWICGRCFIELKDLYDLYRHREFHPQSSCQELLNSSPSTISVNSVKLNTIQRTHLCGTCRVEFPENQFISHFKGCQPSAPFQEMVDPYRIIRGDFSQNRFKAPSCTAMAAAFIYFATFRNIRSFTNIDINATLHYGFELYKVCRERLGLEGEMLTAMELQGYYNQPSEVGSQLYFAVHEQHGWHGLLRGSRQPPLDNLSTSIGRFLTSEYSYAILTTNLLSFATVKQQGCFYLFDSHSRDHRGRPKFDYSGNDDGKACVIQFNSFGAAHPSQSNSVTEEVGIANRIADHILGNVAEYHSLVGADHHNLEDLSIQEIARYYQYTITPIFITFK